MGTKVINLAREREERTPHASGMMVCMACSHEHMAVTPHPAEARWFECPACHAEKAHWKHPFVNETIKALWECQCGNRLFYVADNGTYCPNCGRWQYD